MRGPGKTSGLLPNASFFVICGGKSASSAIGQSGRRIARESIVLGATIRTVRVVYGLKMSFMTGGRRFTGTVLVESGGGCLF